MFLHGAVNATWINENTDLCVLSHVSENIYHVIEL